MAVCISQVIAETGDMLIGRYPMLALTCKSFYKFRVLNSLGAAPICLKHVTRPTDYSRVTITNVAVHVPALTESANRLSAVRWELDFRELRAFLEGRPEWPKALKDVEIMIRSPDIAEGIAYLKAIGDFGPEKLHVCVDDGQTNTVDLSGVKSAKFAEVFGDCVDVKSVLRACLTEAAKGACESAGGCVHLGRGECASFDAMKGLELEDEHWTNDTNHEYWQDDL